MASNPRLDDLRKRLEKDPGSRLFAQLAEELRKEGELEEAVRVCREGLQKQPMYPSARMTLGRALFDQGQLTAARPEFEAVLKGAPDNILASRLLGECLEGLGDLPAALERYKGTLVLAPGDKQIQGRIQDVEARLSGGGAAVAPAVPVRVPAPEPAVAGTAPSAPAAGPVPAEPPPIPLAVVDDESFELDRPYDQPGTLATVVLPRPPVGADPAPSAQPSAPVPRGPDLPPIPIVATDEEFELERPLEVPVQKVASPGPLAAPPTSDSSGMGMEFSFDEFGTASAVVAEPEVEVAPLPSFAPEFGLPAAPPDEVRPPGVLVPEPTRPAEARTVEATLERGAEYVAEEVVEEEVVEDLVEPEVEAGAEAAVEPERPLESALDPDMEPVILDEESFQMPPPVGGVVPSAVPKPREEPELVSSTLAELYFNQGFTDKALDVYRQLVQREPTNERAQARLKELQALEDHLRQEEAPQSAGASKPAADPDKRRRKAVERTIARLEALLAATRKA